MTHSLWIISTNTKEEKKGRKLLSRVLNKLGVSNVIADFKVHHETKLYFAEFKLEHLHASKPELVFEVIKYRQEIGYYWQLFGSIETQSYGRSEESRISGITSMEWHVEFD